MNPKQYLQHAALQLGFSVTTAQSANELYRQAIVCSGILKMINEIVPEPIDGLGALAGLERSFINFCLKYWNTSHSQARQDLFASWALSGKRRGSFIEFGAADGLTNSNTAMLQSEYGWSGILIEPDPRQFARLTQNRPGPKCINAAVAPKGGAQANLVQIGQLSTLVEYAERDYHANTRKKAGIIKTRLIELNEQLESAASSGQPVDYISVDTEGSEVDILKSVDFGRFPIPVITVEHNEREADKRELESLMSELSYVKMFGPSITAVDYWFVRRDTYEALVETIERQSQ